MSEKEVSAENFESFAKLAVNLLGACRDQGWKI
jgi:hypothetical protein